MSKVYSKRSRGKARLTRGVASLSRGTGPRVASSGSEGRAQASAAGGIVKIGSRPARIDRGEVLIIGRREGRFEVVRIRTALPVAEIRRAVTVRLARRVRARRRPAAGSEGKLSSEEKILAEEGGFDVKPFGAGKDDPVEVAAQEFARLRRESYTTEETTRILKVNGSRVRQRLTSRPPTLFGIKVDGEWRVPRFQFAGSELVPGIEVVVARLRPGLSPVSVSRWFTSSNPDLPADENEERYLTPLEWLRAGRPAETVAEIAADL